MGGGGFFYFIYFLLKIIKNIFIIYKLKFSFLDELFI